VNDTIFSVLLVLAGITVGSLCILRLKRALTEYLEKRREREERRVERVERRTEREERRQLREQRRDTHAQWRASLDAEYREIPY
jgi:chaperonin cofactor prefoldin